MEGQLNFTANFARNLFRTHNYQPVINHALNLRQSAVP